MFQGIALIIILCIVYAYAETTTTIGTTGATDTTTTGATDTTGTTDATTGSTTGSTPKPSSDNKSVWDKFLELGIVNWVLIGVGVLVLACCLYSCTCFDTRKPPVSYDDIVMHKFE